MCSPVPGLLGGLTWTCTLAKKSSCKPVSTLGAACRWRALGRCYLRVGTLNRCLGPALGVSKRLRACPLGPQAHPPSDHVSHLTPPWAPGLLGALHLACESRASPDPSEAKLLDSGEAGEASSGLASMTSIRWCGTRLSLLGISGVCPPPSCPGITVPIMTHRHTAEVPPSFRWVFGMDLQARLIVWCKCHRHIH